MNIKGLLFYVNKFNTWSICKKSAVKCYNMAWDYIKAHKANREFERRTEDPFGL